jgi:hypothetical protein
MCIQNGDEIQMVPGETRKISNLSRIPGVYRIKRVAKLKCATFVSDNQFHVDIHPNLSHGAKLLHNFCCEMENWRMHAGLFASGRYSFLRDLECLPSGSRTSFDKESM